MNRFICIHGHFYQPPRENAWLEAVEYQDSAYPYHDWNARISAECYAPNMSARILNDDMRIEQIINNYSQINFDFGPTVLSWLERNMPEVYAAIIEADRQSRSRFGGHGSALAHVYNHVIMPLASARDKHTQIIWAIDDFKARFGRDPEGMWLPETAVDTETLELLVQHGIGFTVLGPRQAAKVRKIGDKEWQDVGDGRIDPRRAYLCPLSGDRKIDLFFYDGGIAHDVAFGDLLNDGRAFAERMAGALDEKSDEGQISHIATDGESYGHHHQHGDMALAYCLDFIEKNKLADLTVYAEFLEKWPPQYEVEIIDNTSWSCVHGIERWRANCGCKAGGHPSWQQEWRGPLRLAFDWLGDTLAPLYEEQARGLLKDPWAARNDYIAVVRDRSDEGRRRFFDKHAAKELSAEDTVRALKLLEMQRQCLLMYTSCAWFFEEISGIETIQVMQYAARAIQLARDISGMQLESSFTRMLEYAPSNRPDLKNGANVYERYIRPAVVELDHVGAHFAMTSLFNGQTESGRIYCYDIGESDVQRAVSGGQSLLTGRIRVKSNICLEEKSFWFTAVHLGDTDMLAGVRPIKDDVSFDEYQSKLPDLFSRREMSQIRLSIDRFFGQRRYNLRNLFSDDRRRILRRLVESSVREVHVLFRQMYQSHLSLIQAIEDSGIPLPGALAATADFVCNADLRQALEQEEIDEDKIGRAIEEVQRHKVSVDAVTLGFILSGRLSGLARKLTSTPYDHDTVNTMRILIEAGRRLNLSMNLWEAQNMLFQLMKAAYTPERLDDRSQVEKESADLIRRMVDLMQLRKI